MNPRIKSVQPTNDYQLMLEFTNGELGLYGCKPLLNFGVFKELQQLHYFRQVTVIDGTVRWPHEQDICPDTLYLDSLKMDKVTAIWFDLISKINNGKACSSEKALVFHFAWQLKECYKENITLDFEPTLFDDEEFSDGKFLDLYAVINNSNEKLGFEFKFPKKSALSKPNYTQTRIKIVNDIKRLCWLKEKKKIDKGYFLCATDGQPFIERGKKVEAVCFETYQGSSYTVGSFFPCNGKLSAEMIKVPKDITFNWNRTPPQKYAWLTPILI